MVSSSVSPNLGDLGDFDVATTAVEAAPDVEVVNDEEGEMWTDETETIISGGVKLCAMLARQSNVARVLSLFCLACLSLSVSLSG